MFWIEKTCVKAQGYKTSSEKTVAWYMRQEVTDHELQGTGISCWGGLYPVCVGKNCGYFKQASNNIKYDFKWVLPPKPR